VYGLHANADPRGPVEPGFFVVVAHRHVPPAGHRSDVRGIHEVPVQSSTVRDLRQRAFLLPKHLHERHQLGIALAHRSAVCQNKVD
jgi:hypothetical protein